MPPERLLEAGTGTYYPDGGCGEKRSGEGRGARVGDLSRNRRIRSARRSPTADGASHHECGLSWRDRSTAPLWEGAAQDPPGSAQRGHTPSEAGKPVFSNRPRLLLSFGVQVGSKNL